MDKLSPAARSENMRRIRSKGTKSELKVRSLVRKLGYSGYRLNRPELPGKPDIAWIGRKIAIHVHGCFWHGHSCPEGRRIPKTNSEYWIKKISRNSLRDESQLRALAGMGWKVLIIWDCELRDETALVERLRTFLAKSM